MAVTLALMTAGLSIVGVLPPRATPAAQAATTATYRDAVLADNPISYWQLGESAGSSTTDEKGVNTGSIQGGVTLGVPGPIAGTTAMRFDGGACTGVDVGGNPSTLAPASSLTVEMWMRTTRATGGVAFRWRWYGYSIDVGGDGTVGFGGHLTSGSFGVRSVSAVNDGQWHHIAGVKDGAAVRMYVDGVLDAVGRDAGGNIYYEQGGGVAISRDGIACDDIVPSYSGDLAHVAVYGVGLNDSQARAHYRAAGPRGGDLTAAQTLGGWNPAIPHAACCQGTAADPVNTATGNFFETFTDFAIPGRGIPLNFARTYNSSRATQDGPVGFGWTHSYGASLRVDPTSGVVTIVQENGSEVEFTPSGTSYAAAPRVVATLTRNADQSWTFTRGGKEILSFDPSGKLASLQDLNGYTTSLAYNTSGQLETVTDPAGRRLTLAWSGGRIQSVADPSSPARVVTFGYDGAGDLTSTTDPAGGPWAFAYDAHRMTSKLDPAQMDKPDPAQRRAVVNHYDAAGRVDWQTDQLGRTTSFDYASIPGSTKVTDPRGNVTVERYEHGLRMALTRGYGSANAATTTYTYDLRTLGIETRTDPNGNLTSSTYDQSGNLLTRTDPLGRMSSFTYTPLNLLASATVPLTADNARTVTTTYTYDGAGNLASESTPLVDEAGTVTDTRTVTYNYDPAKPGDVTSVVDPRGKTWSFAYDANGYRREARNPVGGVTKTTYNTIGFLEAVVPPRGNLTGVDPSLYRTTYTPTPSARSPRRRTRWGRRRPGPTTTTATSRRCSTRASGRRSTSTTTPGSRPSSSARTARS